ncbi:MAG: squalene/phytoene synthase family protein [Elusimicrobiales bacterium]|nr:squalene/phytoene synthase family protein [Elusimicrobiales bacterium]
MAQPYEAGSSFRPAFFFLKKNQRRALSAYYGYARAVDDIADDPGLAQADRAERLGLWRAAVERLFSGGSPASPLEAELAWAIGAFPLRREHFLLVLDGVCADLEKKTYASYSELEHYMYRVASAVGMACLAIFGYDAPDAGLLAEKLGYAVQLTNILRDAAQDHAAGRVYIPAEDLARFGCAPSSLGGSNYPPDFIELMKFEAARARALYAEALSLADPARKRSLAGALVMGSLYRELLEKLERSGFRVKDGKVRLTRTEKFLALIKAWRDYVKI